jgi:hypothetical protein
MRRSRSGNPQVEIARLSDLSLSELREIWLRRLGTPTPPTSTELTRRWLAWELQAQARDGFDAPTRRRLRQIAKALRADPDAGRVHQPSPAPGQVLMREWNGVTHRVVVLDDGFSWNSERYSSLSEIALRITGTRWSGPRFFGLRQSTS